MGCAALVLTLAVSPAYADDVMTEESIKAFLAETTAMTQQNNPMTQSEIVEYLNDRVKDSGQFTSNVMYDMPGQPLQTQSINLDKKGYIKNIASARSMMKDYVSEITLKDANISGDGMSATIHTTTTESGLAPTGGDMMAPFEGSSSCEQILELYKGRITLASAACETIITFIEM